MARSIYNKPSVDKQVLRKLKGADMNEDETSATAVAEYPILTASALQIIQRHRSAKPSA